jgi:predicted nucleic acid-binding protein
MCNGIDLDDTIFVAMGEFLDAKLWTGDKQLLQGLSEKDYNKVITTEELYMNFIKNESKAL